MTKDLKILRSFRKLVALKNCGGIAQLVERLVRNEKVWGSNPHTSTNLHRPKGAVVTSTGCGAGVSRGLLLPFVASRIVLKLELAATMQLTLSDDIVLSANLSESEMRLALALALFQQDRITLAQGARLAQLDRIAFQRQLAAHKISIHYGEDELAADLRTIDSL